MELSLTCGGPFFHLMRRLHLMGPARAVWLAAIAWLPLVIVAIVERAVTGHVDPSVLDPSVHVRLLVSLPLLIAAENLLEIRGRSASEHLRAERIVERASLDAIIQRAEHARDSWVPEALIVVIVFGAGQLWLREHVWGGVRSPTLVGVWSLLFALPLVQFLVARWLWRWIVWCYVLARLARLDLSLNALHPDRAAGLKVLSGPTEAFAVFAAAIIAIAASSWVRPIHDGVISMDGMMPTFFGFVVVTMVIACGPLVMFSRKLYRARHRDTSTYHVLARGYTDAFRAKWLHTGEVAELDTSDIRTLDGLVGSYRAADETRLYPFGARTIVNLWAGAVLPMIPLVIATSPIQDVATHLGRMLFGVAP